MDTDETIALRVGEKWGKEKDRCRSLGIPVHRDFYNILLTQEVRLSLGGNAPVLEVEKVKSRVQKIRAEKMRQRRNRWGRKAS